MMIMTMMTITITNNDMSLFHLPVSTRVFIVFRSVVECGYFGKDYWV